MPAFGLYALSSSVTGADCASWSVLHVLGNLALMLALGGAVRWVFLRDGDGLQSPQSFAPTAIDRDRQVSVRSLFAAAAATVAAVFVMDAWWGVPCPPPTRHRVAFLAVIVAFIMALFIEFRGPRDTQA